MLKDGAVDDCVGVLVITACVLDESFGGAQGGLCEALTVGVLTDEFDDGAVVAGYLFGEFEVLVAE